MTTGATILIVEDENQMRRYLRTALEVHDYRILEAGTAREGLAHITAHNPDVMLLDLGLPDGDGIDVTRRLREWSRMPVIVLSARGREEDKVAALDAGADDYLTKPFSVGELLARVRVALRHATHPADGTPEPVVTTGELTLDLANRQVRVAGEEVHLTPLEYRILATLARHVGKVLTHRQLLHEVWGVNYIAHTHYLRVYMAQLRHKIEHDPARPRLLITEAGVGYRLKTE
jgi:two-component system, OmpR family, KDP operon response regulator KdpE